MPREAWLAATHALCACSAVADSAADREEAIAEAGGTAIACALDGAREFSDDCWFQRVSDDSAQLLVIHHPDGGFRRLAIVDGGQLVAADGADRTEVARAGEMIEVALAGARYRLPAAVGTDDGTE